MVTSVDTRARRTRAVVGLLARLVVGGVWVVAGVLKLPHPSENVRSVRAFQILPEAVVPLVGHALPALEIVVGVSLLAGFLTRVTATVSALMLLAFVVGISAAWARGLAIDCGCFGGGAGPSADATAAYPWDIARDVALLVLSVLLAWRPRTRWSLDRRLLPAEA